jgi:hypothetical protein
MDNKKFTQKRCIYCGGFFKPDPRAGDRQKTCKKIECRKKRKQYAQKIWNDANPDYFKGRYENTREYRRKHPDYQREYRARRKKEAEIQDKIPLKKPLKTIRLAIPLEWLKNEIQDEICLVKQCGCGVFVAGGGVNAP